MEPMPEDWITDEHGGHAFLVDGKVLRLRQTLELKDHDDEEHER